MKNTVLVGPQFRVSYETHEEAKKSWFRGDKFMLYKVKEVKTQRHCVYAEFPPNTEVTMLFMGMGLSTLKFINLERLPMFPRECCLHKDPTTVYDCVAWNSEEKKYKLKNDAGMVEWVGSNEFTPISEMREGLLAFNDEGRIITVTDEGRVYLTEASSSHAERSAGLGLDRASAPRRGTTKALRDPKPSSEASERAKAEVKNLLEGRVDRLELATVAGGVTGDDPNELVEKYQHLDNGRFRMTLGNKMRGVLAKRYSA